MVCDTIGRSLIWRNNTTADPDGNEIAHNTVVGRLRCGGDSPAPQLGDSKGGPNTVLGHGWGWGGDDDRLQSDSRPGGNQCAGLAVPN